MKNFEYAQPRTDREAVELLADPSKQSAVLAGGTDLVGLIKRMVITPDRVVNIREIAALQKIEADADGNTWIGAAVSLDQWMQDRVADGFPSVQTVIQGISSIQLQSQGTLIGELLRWPQCWYFRSGHGLLADQGVAVIDGDNRYHAIIDNRGPAKFVSASRLAPALISLGARVRILGPSADDEAWLPLADFYRTPVSGDETENVLQSGQLVTHVVIPHPGRRLAAAYEIRHGEGPDSPLAAAAVNLDVRLRRVEHAEIVLGQVAPTPWVAEAASESLRGQVINRRTAAIAGDEAVAGAVPLSGNRYKIQLARIAVKRALLRAVGRPTGGWDDPILDESNQSRLQSTYSA